MSTRTPAKSCTLLDLPPHPLALPSTHLAENRVQMLTVAMYGRPWFSCMLLGSIYLGLSTIKFFNLI